MARQIGSIPLAQVQLVKTTPDGWVEILRLGDLPEDLGAIVSCYGHGLGVESRAMTAVTAVNQAGAAPGGIRLDVQTAPSMDPSLDREGTLYLDVLVSPGLTEPTPEIIYAWVIEHVLRGIGRVELRFGEGDTTARDVAIALGACGVGLGTSNG